MFRPAPTLETPSKLDSTLKMGVFLDYYVNWRGEFTGQYVVCPLENFVGANLDFRAPAKSFKLSLHRTEVCRRPTHPSGTSPDEIDNPIFPLQQKFYHQNMTLEGMEETRGLRPASGVGDPTDLLQRHASAEGEEGDAEKSSDIVDPESPLYKYPFKISSRGYRLPTDEHGRWIRTTGNWRPSCYSPTEWNRFSRFEKDVLREAYKDGQKKIHLDEDGESDKVAEDAEEDDEDGFGAMSDSGEPYEDAGIAEGCIDPEESDAGPKLKTLPSDTGDRWEKTDNVGDTIE